MHGPVTNESLIVLRKSVLRVKQYTHLLETVPKGLTVKHILTHLQAVIRRTVI